MSAEPLSLDEVLDRFAAELRKGGSPSPTEYVGRHPHLADELPSLLGALTALRPAEPEEAAAQPGHRFGDFAVVREVGRGGMGVVYEAVQVSLGRRVALKVLPPHLLDDPGVRARFEVEAAAAGRLRHPNIVPVYATGERGGVPFYAMQFVAGESLDRLIRRARLAGEPPADARAAAGYAAQAARGLGHAHAYGVTHRDVKPSNLILDEAGVLWVADFGLAKLAGEAGPTRSGALVGTARYLPPEAFDGKAGAAGDVYSLGLTLYELLTGRPAFDEPDVNRLMAQIRGRDPESVRRMNPKVPRDLAAIIHKACDRDPARRYATAGKFADDLDRFLEGRAVSARPGGPLSQAARWSRRNKAPAAAAAGLVLALTAAAVAGWLAAASQAKLRRAEAELVAEQRARVAGLEAANGRTGAVLNFLYDDVLAAPRPPLKGGPGLGRNVTLADALRAAEAKIPARFAGMPLGEASVQMVIGRTWRALADYGRAERAFRRAAELNRSHRGAGHRRAVESLDALAGVIYQAGRPAEAIAIRGAVLKRADADPRPDRKCDLDCRMNQAVVLAEAGRPAEAITQLGRCLDELARGEPNPEAEHIIRANLAEAYRAAGRRDAPPGLLEQIAESAQGRFGPAHPYTLTARHNLSAAYWAAGRGREALTLGEETYQTSLRVHGPANRYTLFSADSLAHTYRSMGRERDKAVPLLESALKAAGDSLAVARTEVIMLRLNLAQMYRALGERRRALPLYESVYEGLKARQFRLPYSAGILREVAAAYHKAGRSDDAARVLAEREKLLDAAPAKGPSRR